MPQILIFFGPNIFPLASIASSDERKTVIFGKDGARIELDSIPDQKADVIVFSAHNYYSEDGRYKTDIFQSESDEKNNIFEQIAALQKKTGAKTIGIAVCGSGLIPKHIGEMANPEELGLLPGTRIMTFSSSKHYSLAFKNFRIIDFITNQKDPINYDELEKRISLEFAVTVKSCVIDKEGDKWSVTSSNYNLHKYPELWAEFKKDPNSGIPPSFPTMAFIESVVRSKTERAIKWFETGEVNIDFRVEGGKTILMLAAINGDAELIGFLSKQMDIAAFDDKGANALIYAAQYGNKAAVERLLKVGLDVNSTDAENHSAIFYAAASGHKDVVEFLLSKNADITKTNHEGKTVFEFTKNPEIIELLKAHQAKSDISKASAASLANKDQSMSKL